jgi:hypothetical protein
MAIAQLLCRELVQFGLVLVQVCLAQRLDRIAEPFSSAASANADEVRNRFAVPSASALAAAR